MYIGSKNEKKGIPKYKELTTITTNGKPVWTGNVNVGKEKMFNDPKRWKESSVIFVNSMSDLFYEGFSVEDKKRAALRIPYDNILYIPLLLFPFIVLLIINDEVI